MTGDGHELLVRSSFKQVFDVCQPCVLQRAPTQKQRLEEVEQKRWATASERAPKGGGGAEKP